MSLIKCPECGNNVSDKATQCPKCGYPINNIENCSSLIQNQQQTNYKPIDRQPFIVIGVIVVIIVIILGVSTGSKKKTSDFIYYPSSNYSNTTNAGNYEKTDAASIFKNLDIKDFSCNSGKYAGEMRCKVKNNNDFTVHGYFYVNFYDDSGHLMYSQLMSISDIGAGDEIACSHSIPKDNYPSGYASVDFSQASLAKRD